MPTLTHPLVPPEVIDAVGGRFALFLILKIVGAYWLRFSFPVPLANAVRKIPYPFFFLLSTEITG
jgi:hypothetical protein